MTHNLPNLDECKRKRTFSERLADWILCAQIGSRPLVIAQCGHITILMYSLEGYQL